MMHQYITVYNISCDQFQPAVGMHISQKETGPDFKSLVLSSPHRCYVLLHIGGGVYEAIGAI